MGPLLVQFRRFFGPSQFVGFLGGRRSPGVFGDLFGLDRSGNVPVLGRIDFLFQRRHVHLFQTTGMGELVLPFLLAREQFDQFIVHHLQTIQLIPSALSGGFGQKILDLLA